MLALFFSLFQLLRHFRDGLPAGRFHKSKETAGHDVVRAGLRRYGILVPGNFGAGAPAVNGSRSLFRVAAEQYLEEFLAGVLTGNAATDIAAAHVVLAGPEEQQMEPDGHDVVVLH
jgi:hypothetical protein